MLGCGVLLVVSVLCYMRQQIPFSVRLVSGGTAMTLYAAV